MEVASSGSLVDVLQYNYEDAYFKWTKHRESAGFFFLRPDAQQNQWDVVIIKMLLLL